MRTKRQLAVMIALALSVGAIGCAQRTASDRRAGADQPQAVRESALHDKDLSRVDEEGKRVVSVGTPPHDAPAKSRERDDGTTKEDAFATGEIATMPATTAPPPPEVMASPVAALRAAPKQAMGAGMPVLAEPAPTAPGYWQPDNTEKYQDHVDNPVVRTAESPVSTFSNDVDTGSYSNVRRMLAGGALPPTDAVRAEEFVNYFDYGYTPPSSLETPFSVTTEIAPSPWNAQRQLLLVGIQGYRVPASQIPASNLVFLIDTSGSMDDPAKLPLLRDAFKQLVPQLRAQDRVSIVVYAGSAGLVLPPTAGDRHDTILAALDALSAGGSTNGGQGIALAYRMAEQAFIKNGVNRVILATDGDFNVGTTDTEALKTIIADKRASGVALTTLGFGAGNYNDEMAEQLADIGNGNHFYIDTANEARKVLVDEMSSTMLTIAKDVKIQIEFNPLVVAEYRLIGYENRQLRREDFANDKVDAGDIGAGHDVTALYELTLVGSDAAQIDPLRYAPASAVTRASDDEIAFLKLRYKRPSESSSRLIERPLQRRDIADRASDRLGFAASVAAFADGLRGGTHLGTMDFAGIAQLARADRRADPFGYRAEFVALVDKAAALKSTMHSDQVAISR
jgi:Ca-activated chloride channel family protein